MILSNLDAIFEILHCFGTSKASIEGHETSANPHVRWPLIFLNFLRQNLGYWEFPVKKQFLKNFQNCSNF